MENADSGDLRRLLRAGGERRSKRAEGQCGEKRERSHGHLGSCRTNSTVHGGQASQSDIRSQRWSRIAAPSAEMYECET
jgi:hypothetical protein